jgi:hypothetical protein
MEDYCCENGKLESFNPMKILIYMETICIFKSNLSEAEIKAMSEKIPK